MNKLIARPDRRRSACAIKQVASACLVALASTALPAQGVTYEWVGGPGMIGEYDNLDHWAVQGGEPPSTSLPGTQDVIQFNASDYAEVHWTQNTGPTASDTIRVENESLVRLRNKGVASDQATHTTLTLDLRSTLILGGPSVSGDLPFHLETQEINNLSSLASVQIRYGSSLKVMDFNVLRHLIVDGQGSAFEHDDQGSSTLYKLTISNNGHFVSGLGGARTAGGAINVDTGGLMHIRGSLSLDVGNSREPVSVSSGGMIKVDGRSYIDFAPQLRISDGGLYLAHDDVDVNNTREGLYISSNGRLEAQPDLQQTSDANGLTLTLASTPVNLDTGAIRFEGATPEVMDFNINTGQGGELYIRSDSRVALYGDSLMSFKGGDGADSPPDIPQIQPGRGGDGGRGELSSRSIMTLNDTSILDLSGGDSGANENSEFASGLGGDGGQFILQDATLIQSDQSKVLLNGGDAIGGTTVPFRGNGGDGGRVLLNIGSTYVIRDSAVLSLLGGRGDETPTQRGSRGDLFIDGSATFAMQGGAVYVGEIQAIDDSFDFQDGLLDFERFDGDLEQHGGVLEVASPYAATRINGTYTQHGGSLRVALRAPNSNTPSSRLFMTRQAPDLVSLGGTLELVLADDYVPTLGDELTVLTSFGLGGTRFSNVVAGPISPGIAWAATYTDDDVRVTAAWIGDADLDGDVDDTDLGVMISNFNGPAASTKTWSLGDVDQDGDVDDTDLGLAISRFSGPLSPASVPEPGVGVLLALAGCATLRRRGS